MNWPKKVHTSEILTKILSYGSKIPQPPITFLMVHLLNGLLQINLESQILGITWVPNGSVPQLIAGHSKQIKIKIKTVQ